LIKIRPGDPNGSIVTAHYSQGISRVVDSLLRGKKGELGHLVEIRMILEGSASYLAALQPKERLEPLEAAFSQMRAARDPGELQQADSAFHAAQGTASGNPFLGLIVSAMEEPVRSSIQVGLPSLGWPDAHAIALKRHGGILEAIRNGEPDEACRIARSSLFETYSKILPAEMTARLRALVEMRDFAALAGETGKAPS
jgi:DNA-binding FadR family transcriptional regulator